MENEDGKGEEREDDQKISLEDLGRALAKAIKEDQPDAPGHRFVR